MMNHEEKAARLLSLIFAPRVIRQRLIWTNHLDYSVSGVRSSVETMGLKSFDAENHKKT